MTPAPELPVGVGAVPLNIVDGVRVGPGAGYLLPALGRPNLTLLARTPGRAGADHGDRRRGRRRGRPATVRRC